MWLFNSCFDMYGNLWMKQARKLMFKVTNKNCQRLDYVLSNTKTIEGGQWRRPGILLLTVNKFSIYHCFPRGEITVQSNNKSIRATLKSVVLVPLLLTLNKYSDAYSEISRIFTMELFREESYRLLAGNYFNKKMGSKYASGTCPHEFLVF